MRKGQAFAATIAEAEPLIAADSGFSVTEALTAPKTVTGIDRVQPTLFPTQIALAASLAEHGVRPGAVIGHSLGEIGAAVVAGMQPPADGVRVICRRSRLRLRLAGRGAVASVRPPATEVRRELAEAGVDRDVVVAVMASPQNTVIGGPAHTVRALLAGWEQRGVPAREVAVDVASHTPQVEPVLTELTALLGGLTSSPPRVPYYSPTLTDHRATVIADASCWTANLREPVRFARAVRAALDDGYRVFLELAPHPLLILSAEETAHAAGAYAEALPCMVRDGALPRGLLAVVAACTRRALPSTSALSCPRAGWWTSPCRRGPGPRCCSPSPGPPRHPAGTRCSAHTSAFPIPPNATSGRASADRGTALARARIDGDRDLTEAACQIVSTVY
ncbi:acyltransferase domain-containing protein [Streptomyces sp. KLMMK]|uniref:acyltransferase domain-containing protein n=1 Tax=Streptomyces sp. KLMMK TaxID=3109353 RepID=UPI00300A754C